MSSGAADNLVPPDADPPAQLDVTRQVGRRIAEFRQQRGLRVAELARRVGVTGSLISQIERGRSRPSISTLFMLGEALAVPMDAFFRADESAPPPSPPPLAPAEGALPAMAPTVRSPRPAGRERDRFLVRAGEGARLEIAGGVVWTRLTPENLEEGEFTEVTYHPHSESSSELYRHPGSDWVFVLEGQLEITVGFAAYTLSAGDSLCFPSSIPHRYANTTNEAARAISVNLWDPVVRTLADASRDDGAAEP
jgi:transcriptional regulator with XRE-family HTH domain